MASCYFCGTSVDPPVYRNSLCPSCGKELKICLNCRFYSPGAHWDCGETISEPVREKGTANFCDYFSLNTANRKGADTGKSDNAKNSFNSLFSDE